MRVGVVVLVDDERECETGGGRGRRWPAGLVHVVRVGHGDGPKASRVFGFKVSASDLPPSLISALS